MNNSGELRSRIRQNFINSIALQMPDRFEYEAVILDRTEIIPEARTPGRGLIKAPHPVEFQTALCVRKDKGLSLAQTLRRRFAAIAPQSANQVKKLGVTLERLSFQELMGREDVSGLGNDKIALGLDSNDMLPFVVNLDDEFCYTVGGSGESGKSNLLKVIASQCKDKGARLFLFENPDGLMGESGLFEKVVHDDLELFELMQNVLVQEFIERNGKVNDARDNKENVLEKMREYTRIIFVIDDMTAFMKAVYSKAVEMSDFIEIALQKGREHKIQFFAAVTTDDYSDCTRFLAMRTWADWGRGVHLGGMFDQQSILHFDMSPADSVRQLPAGTGYGELKGKTVKIVTALFD
jgi:S-DNA-T family DNA segregation ATPase FtsK/SpoIIIE